MPTVPELVESSRPQSSDKVATAASPPGGSLEEQLESIMRKNNQVLFRVARSILHNESEAEEVVQSAYLVAFARKDQFSGGPNLSAWLRKITINRALDRRRQLQREQCAAESRLEIDSQWRLGTELSLSPEDASAKRQLLGLIERASDELPEALRTVFVLRDVQELSGAETADCLGIAEGAVRVRLSRARAMMRTRLGEEADAHYKNLFQFDGERCDRIVQRTLASLSNTPDTERPNCATVPD